MQVSFLGLRLGLREGSCVKRWYEVHGLLLSSTDLDSVRDLREERKGVGGRLAFLVSSGHGDGNGYLLLGELVIGSGKTEKMYRREVK